MNRPGLWIVTASLAVILVVAGIAMVKRPQADQPGPLPETAAQTPAASAPAPSGPNALLAQAKAAQERGASLEARQLYQKLLEENPESTAAAEAQKRFGAVALATILSPQVTPEAVQYTVEPGDTLYKISKQFGTTVELLKASNQLTTDLIRVGQQLKVAKTQFNLIIDKSQNILTLKNEDQVLKVYRCSTGEGGITPVGTFKIVSRLVDPAWKGVVPPGDPENPLGSRWLGFDLPEYGIHGTQDPDSIGKPVTKGCVRLTNADAEELFLLLPEGTPVTIVE